MSGTPGSSGEHAALQVRYHGCVDYEQMWRQMIDFTATRERNTPDELWVCEHPPIYTLGQAGAREHLLADNGTPLIKTDRGGQITYHGPGQLVIYLMLDVVRRRLKVHELVFRIEQAMIDLLSSQGVAAIRQKDAPGVYVSQDATIAKIGSLGIRVRKKGCYHGLSLNVDMDLQPFSAINPCGYAGLAVTQTKNLGITLGLDEMARRLVTHLTFQLEKA